MHSHMEYRRLKIADLDQLFANRLRALENSPSAFLTTLAEEKSKKNVHFANTLSLSGDDKVIFGALKGGKVIGTVGISREERPKTMHKAIIWGMYIDTDHRKLGVGGKLLDIAILHAQQKMKVAGIYLSVESKNLNAKRLYELKGFKR